MKTDEAVTTHRLTWRRLLWRAALANLVLMLAAGMIMRDREALAFAGLFAVALAMLGLRGGIAGAVMIGVLALNAAAWMAPAAASNVVNREQLLDVVIPASLAVISLTASVAAVVSIVKRRHPDADGRAVRIVAQTALAVFVLAAGAATIQRGQAEAPRPGDVVVQMHSARFSAGALSAPAGEITVAIENKDLFWHTFTIDALGVDVGVPTRGERRVTFDAAPGTYEFYCAIPGHTLAGMKGTLTVG